MILTYFELRRLKSWKVKDELTQMINDSIFDLLYKRGFLPSLYVKPTRFFAEQELRLVFEMSSDVPLTTRITNERLVRHIETVA